MAKLLLVLLAVLLFGWLLFGRKRRGADAALPERPKTPQAPDKLAAMVACSHCGLFVPASDALCDDDGRPYCGQAHRALGPR
jgi:uncharacterized protein